MQKNSEKTAYLFRRLLRVGTAFLLCAALLAGIYAMCGQMTRRDYLYISPHIEQAHQDELAEDLRAENYQELVSAILRLVEDSAESGIIQLHNYGGDLQSVQSDVQNACRSVSTTEPLGAYAVEYMLFECTRILSYYEVEISIAYRRSPQQVEAIQKIANSAEFRSAIILAYRSYAPSVTLDIQYYNDSQYDPQDIVSEVYYSYPIEMMDLPSCTVNFYPENGLHRILEISFEYSDTPENLRRMAVDVANTLLALISQPTSDSSPLDTLIRLHDMLIELVEYYPQLENDLSGEPQRTSEFSIYGALVQHRATSEGYALAFKALCNIYNINCKVITGRYNGMSHAWNIVEYNGKYYHVDVSADKELNTYDSLLKTDEQVSSTHKWNNIAYEVCAGPEVELFPSSGAGESAVG